MIKKLRIQNFVIAKELEIDFAAGMSVLTGETGAGKSLIVDAIMGVLGQRISPDTIRQGAEFAYLEAVFDINDSIRQLLIERAHEELLETDSLILSKTIYPSGSRSRLNGQLVTQSLIRELAGRLIDSMGQHENQILFMEDQHLSLLDELGDATHHALLAQVAQVYQHLQISQRELNGLLSKQAELARQQDFMSFQLNEIQAAELQPDEETQLLQDRDRLRYAEKILSASSEAYASLYDHPNGQSICDQLEGVQRVLGQAARYDNGLDKIQESINNGLELLQDAARSLSYHLETIESNPHQLDSVEERLDTIKRLKHKYGPDVDSILNFAGQLESELKILETAQEQSSNLELQCQQLEMQYCALTQTLHQSRLKLKAELEPLLETELADLGMAKTRFCVELQHIEDQRNERGQNQVRFLMSSNPGEPLRPLARVASGGEASRLLLAFKLVLKRQDSVPTLIFDEVDTGISGKAALSVSHKLARLAKHHQILCITHLPVIAAMADQHLWIEKLSSEHDTQIQIKALDPQARLEKLAQMGSGQVTDTNLDSMREIHQQAQAFKQDQDILHLNTTPQFKVAS